jgi:hypothetical protein
MFTLNVVYGKHCVTSVQWSSPNIARNGLATSLARRSEWFSGLVRATTTTLQFGAQLKQATCPPLSPGHSMFCSSHRVAGRPADKHRIQVGSQETRRFTFRTLCYTQNQCEEQSRKFDDNATGWGHGGHGGHGGALPQHGLHGHSNAIEVTRMRVTLQLS